jgi:hypothetical protein
MKPELLEYMNNLPDELEMAFQRKHRFLNSTKALVTAKNALGGPDSKLVELFVMSRVYDTFLDNEIFSKKEVSGKAAERAENNETNAVLLLNEITVLTKEIGERVVKDTGRDIGYGFAPTTTDPGGGSDPVGEYRSRIEDFGTKEMRRDVKRALADADNIEEFDAYLRWKPSTFRSTTPSLGGQSRPLLTEHTYISALLTADETVIDRLKEFRYKTDGFVDEVRDPDVAVAFLVDVYKTLLLTKNWYTRGARSRGARSSGARSSDEDKFGWPGLTGGRTAEATKIIEGVKKNHRIDKEVWGKYKPIMIQILSSDQSEINKESFIQDVSDEIVRRMTIHFIATKRNMSSQDVGTFLSKSADDIKSTITTSGGGGSENGDLISREELLVIFTRHSEKRGYGVRRLKKLNLEDAELTALVKAAFYQDLFKGQSTAYEKEFDEIVSYGTNPDRALKAWRSDTCGDERAKLGDVKTTFDEIEKWSAGAKLTRKFEKDTKTLLRMKSKTDQLEQLNSKMQNAIDDADPIFLTM